MKMLKNTLHIKFMLRMVITLCTAMREITDLVPVLMVELRIRSQGINELKNGEWKILTLVASATTSGENTTRKYEWYVDGILTSSYNNPIDWGNNLLHLDPIYWCLKSFRE